MSGRAGDVDLACGTGPRSSVRGYLALPASSAGAGVLVLGEASGPSSHPRDVSDRLAREGFVAFAPDLSSDARPSGGDGELDLTAAGEGVDAAVTSLLSHDATVGASVGCVAMRHRERHVCSATGVPTRLSRPHSPSSCRRKKNRSAPAEAPCPRVRASSCTSSFSLSWEREISNR